MSDKGGWKLSGYTAEDRERWRAEILEAKRTMSREEFKDWLLRKMNTVGG